MAQIEVAQIHKHFGSKSATARAIGRTRQAVGDWGDEVPENAANDLVQVLDFPFTLEQLPIRKYRPGPPRRAKK